MRADTAEYLYLILSSKDTGLETEEAEEVLLETEWLVLCSILMRTGLIRLVS